MGTKDPGFRVFRVFRGLTGPRFRAASRPRSAPNRSVSGRCDGNSVVLPENL